MKGGFFKWLSDFFEGSAIIRGLLALASGIYKRIGSGIYGFIFGSYDTMCETYDDSMLGQEQSRKRSRFCRFVSRGIEKSFYVNSISAMMRYLSRLSLRVLAVFLMSAGFYTFLAQTLIYLVKNELNTVSIAVSALMILLGLPLLFSGKSLCRAVSESLFAGNIIRGLCAFKERDLKYDGEPTGKKGIAFNLGLPFGILSCVVDPVLIVIAVLGIIAAYMVVSNAEFGYNAIIFMLPFLVVLPRPTIILAGLVIFTFFSYLIKLIMGKRYFKVELMDIFVVCFMTVMMLGGIVSYGGTQSVEAASIYTSLILGYFLTVGLVNSKEALKRTVKILGVSMLLVALVGVYQNYTGNVSAEWIHTEMYDSIEGRVVSTFENPNMLGEYLILLLPIVAGAMFGEKSYYKKPMYLACFAVGGLCLVYTWARGAWLGFILAAVLFMLMWNKKAMGLIVAGMVALPFSIPFLPQSIVSRFTSIGDLTDTSTNYRVFIWRGSANLASDYALTGIGVGEQAFGRVYPYYSFAGIETAPHAHNLFLQLFIEVGIFGFIIFLAMLICLLQSGFTLAKKGDDKETRLIGCGALAGIFAALLQGMTDYIWYNYRVYFIFWIVIGIVCAAERIDRANRAKKTVAADDYVAELTV